MVKVQCFIILKTEKIETLIEMEKQKDSKFDLYQFCIALREVDDFPDEIDKQPVDMLMKVDVKELKEMF